MFHVITGAIGLYVAGRLFPALPWPAWGKWLAALLVLLVALHHLITRTFFGSMASPEIPAAALAFLGWLFGALLLLAVFLALKDVSTVLFFLLGKAGWRPDLPFTVAAWNGALAATALVLAGIGVWQAVRVPDVRTVEITLDRLPPELDGLRLVQLSDLHASRLLQAPWMRAVVDRTNALHPDLILLTGDQVDGSTAARAADVAPLRDLKARLGVFAIPGNHEYYSNYAAWMAALGKLGLRMLPNAHAVIEEKGHALVVAGTTDHSAARFGLPQPNVAAALAGAPRDAVTVLMAHQPRDAGRNAGAGIDLQLSGHTHGGQIVGLHLVTRAANEGFVSGLYRVGAMALYVSNGAGLWNGLPIRIGRPSEIALIVLRAAAGGVRPDGAAPAPA